jgi:MFS transporter, OPA family, glycerol-3-phosphate transporter
MKNDPTTQPAFRAARLRVLLASMVCYLTYYTGRQSFGFAIPFIEEEMGLSKTQLGCFAAALLWTYAIGGPISGNLADRYGGRRMVSLGAVLSCALNWLVSLGTGFFSLLIPWTANGFAQSMGWAPGSRVLSNWWGREHRGLAFGLFTFAAGLSSVVAFVSSLLILKTLGLSWRWIFRLPVLLLLVGGGVYYVVVRNCPSDHGFDAAADADHQGSSSKQPSGTPQQGYLSILKNPRFVAACVGIGFQNAARYGLLLWVPVHFLGPTWKTSNTAWISVALPAGMALGAVAGGWISDRVFRSVRWKLIATFMSFAAATAILMYLLPMDHVWGSAVLFLCGFFVYGSQSAFWALCPDLLGSRCVGTGVGIMNCFAYVFAGVASPLVGGMIEAFPVVDASTGLLMDNTALIFPAVAGASMMCALLAFMIRR